MSNASGAEFEEALEGLEVADVLDLADVPLDVGLQVAGVPVSGGEGAVVEGWVKPLENEGAEAKVLGEFGCGFGGGEGEELEERDASG